MLAPVTHILPMTTVRRVRLLPVDGRVMVRSGQKVTVVDVLAEAFSRPRHLLLDVRKVLAGGSSERVKDLIERSVGEEVQAGDIIASSGGVLRRQIRAPQDGVIAAINNGQVYLKVLEKPEQLKSGFTGIVTEVIPERGVILETRGALVQGVWGNRRVNGGQLMLLADSPGETLSMAHLDGTPEQLRGKVLFSAYCEEEAVLQEVEKRAVRGLVLASMPAKLIKTASALNIPVILLEGFGRIDPDSYSHEVLKMNQRRQIALNAAVWDNYIGERPEISIPLAGESQPGREMDIFKPGQNVRLHNPPYHGKSGVLEEILPGTSLLPSGLRAASAHVRLNDGEIVMVPLVNMDVIE